MKNKSSLAVLLALLCTFTMGFALTACSGGGTSASSGNTSQTSGNSTDKNSSSNTAENNENSGDNVGSTSEYKFEAEYTDLTDLTGDLGSGTAYGKEMIQADDGASNGYYVENFNIKDSTITYKITSDAATTANMSLLIRATSAGECDSDLLIVKVNGTTVSFTAATITDETEKVTAIKSNMKFTTLVIGNINLIEGENTITFTVGEKPNASGTGTYKLSYGLDAMILSSSTTLTWNPIKDWDSFYEDF